MYGFFIATEKECEIVEELSPGAEILGGLRGRNYQNERVSTLNVKTSRNRYISINVNLNTGETWIDED